MCVHTAEKNEYMTIDSDVAQNIIEKMPEESELYDLADLFKVFGDSTRIKILYALYENEMCVYDIANILNMTQSAISHQLRILKQNRLVKYRKEGKTVLYTLADQHVFTILSQGIEHVEEWQISKHSGSGLKAVKTAAKGKKTGLCFWHLWGC